jgi:hypothetical protein
VRPARGAARAAARLGVRPEVGDDPRAPPGSCTREEGGDAGCSGPLGQLGYRKLGHTQLFNMLGHGKKRLGCAAD